MRIKGLVGLVVTVLVLAGCGGETVREMQLAMPGLSADDDIALRGAPTGGNFFLNGFPTNLRRSVDGNVDVSDFPRQDHALTARFLAGVTNDPSGYPVTGAVYLPFNGPLALDKVSAWPADFARAGQPIQLINIDPASAEYGRRHEVQVSQTDRIDQYRPEHLLQVQPVHGLSLLPNTTYAVIVTDAMPVPSDAVLQQNRQLRAVLRASNLLFGADPEAYAVYAPLRAFLSESGIDPATVMAATVWTTGDPLARFHHVGAAISAHAQTMPELPVSGVERYGDYPGYCIVRGYVEVPGFQTGTAPYIFEGGDFVLSAAGLPETVYQRTAEFILTFPKNQAMPETGFPWLAYVHGAGGRAHQVYDRGEFDHLDPTQYPYYIGEEGQGPSAVAAERGWAAASMAGHTSSDHVGSIIGFGPLEYNILNPTGLTNSYQVQAWERIFFRRIVERLRIPAELCPDVDANGQEALFVDSDLAVSMGQSQGHWVAGMAVAADPEPFQGIIFTGMAGSWSKLFNNNFYFQAAMDVVALSQFPGYELDDAHPFLFLMDWLMSPSDVTVNVEGLMRRPTKTPPHVLGFSGYFDHFTSEPTQRTAIMALGMDLLGPEIGNGDNHRIYPHIAIGGSQRLDYPATNNQYIPGYGLRTNVVTRYSGDNPVLLYNGHEITFQLPAVKHQYGCFLEHLGQGRDPVIAPGVAQGDPCL